jgi:hypothetical protein
MPLPGPSGERHDGLGRSLRFHSELGSRQCTGGGWVVGAFNRRGGTGTTGAQIGVGEGTGGATRDRQGGKVSHRELSAVCGEEIFG